jgi:hypothetical protein
MVEGVSTHKLCLCPSYLLQSTGLSNTCHSNRLGSLIATLIIILRPYLSWQIFVTFFSFARVSSCWSTMCASVRHNFLAFLKFFRHELISCFAFPEIILEYESNESSCVYNGDFEVIFCFLRLSLASRRKFMVEGVSTHKLCRAPHICCSPLDSQILATVTGWDHSSQRW